MKSEPSCDQTEFFHPNGTCVECPVCGPGEQLSEVTHMIYITLAEDLFPLPALLLGSKFIFCIILRTVVLEMVVKVSVYFVKKGRSVQIQV